jgi:hypothetical protein
MWVRTLAAGEINRIVLAVVRATKQLRFTVLPRQRLAERPYPQVYPSGHKEPKRDQGIVC